MDKDNGPVQIHASLSCCNPQNRSLLTKTPDLYKDISIPDHVTNLRLSSSHSSGNFSMKNCRDSPKNSKINYESHEVMLSQENMFCSSSGEGIAVPQFTINHHNSETACHVMVDCDKSTQSSVDEILKSDLNLNLVINEITDPRLNPINFGSSRFVDPAHECNICETSPSAQVTPRCGHIAHEPIIINDHDNVTQDHSDCSHEDNLNDFCDRGEKKMGMLTVGGGCHATNMDAMQG